MAQQPTANRPRNKVRVDVSRNDVAEVKIVDTDLVLTLKDGRKLYISDGAIQSMMDQEFAVEFADGTEVGGQDLLQSAGTADIGRVAVTSAQSGDANAVAPVVVTPPAVADAIAAASGPPPGKKSNLLTWLGVGTPVVGGLLGGVLGGGGGGGTTATATPTPTPTTATTKTGTPVITSVALDDKVSGAEKAAGVAVGGTAEANATVTIIWGSTTKTATASAAGLWSTTFTSAELPADAPATTISATAKTSTALTSDPATRTVLIDSTPPGAPVIAPVTGDNNVGPADRTAGVTVAGTSEPGSIVTVTWGTVSKSVVTTAVGDWSIDFARSEVPAAGNYTVTATARDALDNVGPVGSTAVVVTPAIAIEGVISAGPVIVGNGLTVSLYDGAGKLIVSGVPVAANGTFTATDLPLSAGDVVIARVNDNTTGADYLDEATGVGKDLNAVLLAVGVVDGTSVTLNVNPVTTIAAIKAGLAVDGTGTITSATTVTNANTATAQAFGLQNISIIKTPPIVTNSGNYDDSDGLSDGERLGAVLAALSGADSVNGGNSQATINALAQQVTVTGTTGTLAAPGQIQLLEGATVASATGPSKLAATISDIVAQSSASGQLTISPIATDNVIAGSELSGLVIAGTVTSGATAVSLTFGTRTAAARVSGTSWSYAVTQADITALGADGGKVISAQADFSGGASAVATRPVSLKITPPATPTFDSDAYDVVNAAEKTAGIRISGAGEAGSTIVLGFGTVTKTKTVGSDGKWSIDLARTEIAADGSTSLSVFARDSVGNSSPTISRNIQVDTIAPSAPIFTFTKSLIGPIEKQGGFEITGTAEPLAKVRVTFGTLDRTVTASVTGDWTLQVLSSQIPDDGDYEVAAVQTDAAGNGSLTATRALKVDAQPPAAPRIFAVTGDNIVNAEDKSAGVSIRGTGEVNSTIEVTWGLVTRSARVQTNGTWTASFASNQVPADGKTTVVARATDSSGNVSADATLAVTVDTVSETVQILSVATDNVINAAEKASRVEIRGKAEAGAAITVTMGTATQRSVVNADGDWVVSFLTADVPADTNSLVVTAQAVDTANNRSAVTSRTVRVDTQAPGLPTIDLVSGDDAINIAEQQSPVEVTGTAEPSSAVTVRWGTVSKVVTAGVDGKWLVIFTPAQIPQEAATEIRVTAEDSAGNVSAPATRPVIVDGVSTRPAIETIGNGDVVNAAARDAGLTIRGTAEPLSTVVVSLDTTSQTVTAGSDGRWQTVFDAVAVPLAGSATIRAVATDKYGNISLEGSRSFQIDTQVAAANVLSAAGDGAVNSNERLVGIEVTGTAEAGSTVTLDWNGQTSQATAGLSGAWTARFERDQIPATDGNSFIVATVTDAAGNRSVESRTAITVDLTAPDAPVLDKPIADDRIVNKDEQTNGVTISGKAEAGATVEVDWSDISTKTVKADAQGAWSVTFTAAQMHASGTALVTVSQTDVAGNVGASQAFSVTVNTGEPARPSIDPVTTDNTVNINERAVGVRVSGYGAVASATIELDWAGATAQTSADADGRWFYVFASDQVPSGETSLLRVRQKDLNGNYSQYQQQTVPLDFIRPATPQIVQIGRNDLPGKGDYINAASVSEGVLVKGIGQTSGQLITVTWGGFTQTTTVDTNREWSVRFPQTQIPAGANPRTVAITAIATDDAGNDSAPATREALFDTLGPTSLTFAPIAGDNILNASERLLDVAVAGTTEANALVYMSYTVAGRTTTLAPVRASDTGAWTATIAQADLPLSGRVEISAYVVDEYGNTGTSNTSAVTVNTTQPPLPTIVSIAGDGYLNADEITKSFIVTGLAASDARAVEVRVGNVTRAATLNAATNSWTVQFDPADLPAGETAPEVQARQTNSLGNVSDWSKLAVSIDLQGPTANAIDRVSGDGYVNGTEATAPLVITGTTERSASVRVQLVKDDVVVAETTVPASATDGTWTASFAASAIPADGAAAVRVLPTDVAGNPGTSKDLGFTIDRQRPVAAQIDPVSVDDVLITSELGSPIDITGTKPADASAVQVTWNGVTVNAVLTSTTTWKATFQPAQLPTSDGTSTITAITIDDAGNRNDAATRQVTVTLGAPPPPVIDPVSNGYLNGNEISAPVTVTGTARPGATVSVSFAGGTPRTALAGATDGSWSVTFQPGQFPTTTGTYNVTAFQTDTLGRVSDPQTAQVEVDLTAPVGLGFVSVGNNFVVNKALRDTGSVDVTVTADSSANAVDIVWDGRTRAAAKVQNTNNWVATFTSTDIQTQGAAVPIEMRATDRAGNTASATRTIRVDYANPDPITFTTVDTLLNGSEITQPLSLAGTKEAGARVVLTFNGAQVEATEDATDPTRWTAQFAAGQVPKTPGFYSLSGYAVDAAGNAGTPTTRQIEVNLNAPAAPTINPISDGWINAAEVGASLVISGIADPGNQVTVTIPRAGGGTASLTTSAAADTGVWQVSFAGNVYAKDDGTTYTVTAIQTNSLGNPSASGTQTYQVDLINPGLPGINAITSDNRLNAAEVAAAVLPLSGTAPEAGRVRITWKNVDDTVLASATVNVTGPVGARTWSYDLPLTTELRTALQNGDTSVVLTMIDPAGNESTPFTQKLTVDRQIPIDVVFDPIAGDDVLNISELTGPVILSGTKSEDATVSLFWNGNFITTSQAANNPGRWTVTVPANQLPTGTGESVITANSTDAAGNNKTTYKTITIDNVKPAAPVIAPISGNFINAAEAAPNASVTVSGSTAVKMSQVLVTFPGANGAAGVTRAATLDAAGTGWTVSFASGDLPAADGSYVVRAIGTTPNGNESFEGTRSVTIDKVNPVGLIVLPVSGDNYVNANEIGSFTTVAGNTELLSTVTIEWLRGAAGTAVYATTTANVNGANWTATLPAGFIDADGDYRVRATAMDQAGNTSVFTRTFNVDRVNPGLITFGTVAGDDVINFNESTGEILIQGTKELGTTAYLTLAGNTVATTATGDTSWEYRFRLSNIPGGLPEGINTFSGYLQDAAGNQSAAQNKSVRLATVRPDQPVITQNSDGVINDAEASQTLVIAGTAATSASDNTVRLTILNPDGSVYATRTGAVVGNAWSFSFAPGAFPATDNTTYTLNVVQIDAYGNTSTALTQPLAVDRVAPGGLDVTSFGSGFVINAAARDAGVQLTATADSTATAVTATLNGVTKTLVKSGENWIVTFAPGELPTGEQTLPVQIRAVDQAGNPATFSRSITFDTVNPNAPTVPALIFGDNRINASEASGTVSITGSGTPNGTVVASWVGGIGLTPVSTTIQANGQWTLNILSTNLPEDGLRTLRFIERDVAGNDSTPVDRNIDIDRSNPAAPQILAMSNDYGTQGDFVTDRSSTVLVGSADAGTVIRASVTINGVTTALAPVTADGGRWTSPTISLAALAFGSSATVTVTATDAAGNEGAASTQTITRQAIGVAAGAGLIDTASTAVAAARPTSTIIGKSASDRFGAATAGGDVTGDGRSDLIVSGYLNDLGGGDAGEVYIYSGTATLPSTLDLSTATGNNRHLLTIRGTTGENLGGAVAAIGDVNGDGIGDMLLGARESTGAVANGNPIQAGAAYVVFGRSNWTPGTVLNLSALTPDQGFVIRGQGAQDRYGSGVAGTGDMNGDGIADFAIGMRGYDGATADTGGVLVFFGRQDSDYAGTIVNNQRELALASMNIAGHLLIRGANTNDQAGFAISAAGDVNGDGRADLLISLRQSVGTIADIAYVVYGKASLNDYVGAFTSVASGRRILDLATLNPADGFVLRTASADYNNTGSGIAGIGDINGDGFADIAVGAGLADSNGLTDNGAAYILYGKAGGLGSLSSGRNVLTLETIDASTGFIVRGGASSDQLGRFLNPAGDVNGDGLADFWVSAHLQDRTNPTQADAGAAYLILGRSDRSYGVTTGGQMILDAANFGTGDGLLVRGPGSSTNSTWDQLGFFVAGSGIGDMTGDGVNDMFMTAWQVDQPSRTEVGAGYLIAGSTTLGGMTVAGDAGANLLVGGSLADAITGGGGADTIYARGGNDRITIADTSFAWIDGGTGDDTLRLSGAGQSLNLTTVGSKLAGIERIDIGGSGANTLTLNAAQLLALSDTSDRLIVTGGADDSVNATGFSLTGTSTLGGVTYNVYAGAGGADLWVQQGVNVTTPSQFSAVNQLVF